MREKELFDELAEELSIDIEYDSQKKIAVIRSMIGNTATYFGVPLLDEVRAEDPEEAVKKKIRKVVGIGRRTEKVRNIEITGRIDHHGSGGRYAAGTQEPVCNAKSRMDHPRRHGDRSYYRRISAGVRVQQKRRKKMREPSIKDAILITITVVAFLLALSGAEMLTNMDPHPAAGCACLALGSTWIILIGFVNSKAGQEFMEDVRCLK